MAIREIAESGYEATTIRQIAAQAGVSPGLVYKYFPSKQAIVLALYDQLSAEYAARAQQLSAGSWTDRFRYVLDTSLQVLAPHRAVLASLAGVLVADPHDSLFASGTAFSRQRVLAGFVHAVTGADDAPPPELGHALARLLYLAHLLVILWWLLDKSPDQRATKALVAALEGALPFARMAIHLPQAAQLIAGADALVRDALLSPATESA